MTLQDALRAKRKFKRAHQNFWNTDSDCLQFDQADVLADDWQIEPRTIQVSGQDLIDIAKALSKDPAVISKRSVTPIELARLFVRELELDQ